MCAGNAHGDKTAILTSRKTNKAPNSWRVLDTGVPRRDLARSLIRCTAEDICVVKHTRRQGVPNKTRHGGVIERDTTYTLRGLNVKDLDGVLALK